MFLFCNITCNVESCHIRRDRPIFHQSCTLFSCSHSAESIAAESIIKLITNSVTICHGLCVFKYLHWNIWTLGTQTSRLRFICTLEVDSDIHDKLSPSFVFSVNRGIGIELSDGHLQFSSPSVRCPTF